ncbi:MAG: ShlB/FhaC/HecB family hemolysin secretion/activation protein [Pseudomonadota bacterium]
MAPGDIVTGRSACLGRFARVALFVTVLFSSFSGLSGPVFSQVACLPISRIATTGVTLLPDDDLRAVLAPFQGRCLGLAAFDDALRAVTLAYVDLGYIGARAYLPAQDLSDGVLEIAVVEGSLEAVRFNGAPDPRWERVVFPGLVGRPVQLRAIEQGLDIIRSMPSYGAEMTLSAGASPGGSVLEVAATSRRPWTLRVGANNYGSRTDAVDRTVLSTYSGTVDLSWDHALGLNETWTLGWQRGTESYPFDLADGDYATERVSFGVRAPYGPWTLSLDHMRSDYGLTSFGMISFIPSDGWVRETRGSVSRLLGRGRDGKTTLTGTLEARENRDRVAGIVIDASSRRLSSFRLDLDHDRVLWSGTLRARVGVERGLKLFDAEVLEEVSEGQPEAQFTLVDGSVSYGRSWGLESGRLRYSGSLSGQYGFDALHGNYQFNLGGVSTVRGTSRALMSGARGMLWRNEVGFTPARQDRWPGTVEVYGALDVGHVFARYSTTVDASDVLIGGGMSGAALGVRGQFGRASVDVAWHRVLSVPGGLDLPGGEVLVSVSTRF